MGHYRVASPHAEETADGLMRAPGDEFTLDAKAEKEPYNQGKIESGQFEKTDDKPPPHPAGEEGKEGSE